MNKTRVNLPNGDFTFNGTDKEKKQRLLRLALMGLQSSFLPDEERKLLDEMLDEL